MEVFRTVPKPNMLGFKPVVIVIENDIEARLMWLLLNSAGIVIRRDSIERYENLNDRMAMDIMRTELWSSYNAQYEHPHQPRSEEPQTSSGAIRLEDVR